MGACWKKLGFVVARRPAHFNKHKNFQIVVFFPSLHLLASRGRSAAIKYRSTKKKQKTAVRVFFFTVYFLLWLRLCPKENKEGSLLFQKLWLWEEVKEEEERRFLEIFPQWIFGVAVASASEFALQLPGPQRPILTAEVIWCVQDSLLPPPVREQSYNLQHGSSHLKIACWFIITPLKSPRLFLKVSWFFSWSLHSVFRLEHINGIFGDCFWRQVIEFHIL